MDFLGIGPLEIILIFVIILIVLGPNEMIKASTSIGNFIRKVVSSEGWRTIQKASRELRTMPNRLAREAGIEEFQKQLQKDAEHANPIDQLNKIGDPELEAWTTFDEDIPQDDANDLELNLPPELIDEDN
ncbi:MAG: hypothetical protein N2D54_08785 [Chloroflexota bacterium]